VVPRIELCIKSPTLCFTMSTQLAVAGKVIYNACTSWHYLLLHVHLSLLLVWGSLPAIPPLKTIWLLACGLLLPTICHMMDYFPIEWTYLWVSTNHSAMSFLTATLTSKGCFTWCISLALLLLVPTNFLSTSCRPQCWLTLYTFFIASLLQYMIRRMK